MNRCVGVRSLVDGYSETVDVEVNSVIWFKTWYSYLASKQKGGAGTNLQVQ